jgi:hypothetical protein
MPEPLISLKGEGFVLMLKIMSLAYSLIEPFAPVKGTGGQRHKKVMNERMNENIYTHIHS